MPQRRKEVTTLDTMYLKGVRVSNATSMDYLSLWLNNNIVIQRVINNDCSIDCGNRVAVT